MVFVAPIGFDTFYLLTKFPVRTLADLRGRKLAGAGAVSLWEAPIGIVPVQGNFSVHFNNLKTGVYDGLIAFTTGYYPNKLHEVAPYATKVNFGAMPGGGVTVNKTVWARLPEVVRRAMREAALDYRTAQDETMTRLVDTFERKMAEEGTQFSQLAADQKAAWAKAMPNIAQQWAARARAQGLRRPQGAEGPTWTSCAATACRWCATGTGNRPGAASFTGGSPRPPPVRRRGSPPDRPWVRVRAPPRPAVWRRALTFEGVVSVLNSLGSLWIFAPDADHQYRHRGPHGAQPAAARRTGAVKLSIVAIVFIQLGHTLRSGRMTRSDGLLRMLRVRLARTSHGITLVFNLAGGGAVRSALPRQPAVLPRSLGDGRICRDPGLCQLPGLAGAPDHPDRVRGRGHPVLPVRLPRFRRRLRLDAARAAGRSEAACGNAQMTGVEIGLVSIGAILVLIYLGMQRCGRALPGLACRGVGAQGQPHPWRPSCWRSRHTTPWPATSSASSRCSS